jgi:hypothetical protein
MPAVPKFEGDKIVVKSTARDQAQAFVDAGNYNQFASEMQSSYVNHFNNVLAASEFLAAESHRRSVEALKSFSTDLGNKLRETLVAQERSIESMRLRGDLLWWQQTAFSPSRRVGYSEMEPVEVPLIAALDLHLLMPNVAPVAAEHMLSELVSKGDQQPEGDDRRPGQRYGRGPSWGFGSRAGTGFGRRSVRRGSCRFPPKLRLPRVSCDRSSFRQGHTVTGKRAQRLAQPGITALGEMG